MSPITPLKMDGPNVALEIGQLTKSAFGGFFANITSEVFQTPIVKCLGASIFGEEKKKFYLNIAPDDTMAAFLNALDEQVIAICRSQWEAWFKREFSDADEACFCRSLALSDDGTTFKFALHDSKTCITEVFNSSNHPIAQEEAVALAQGASLACILQMEGLWFSKGRFGPRIKVMQVKLYV